MNESIDIKYMRMAYNEARAAEREGEIPIGAVIVSADGRVVGSGHNMTQALNDVTAHAEMIAITAAEQTLGSKYLSGCTLYVTVEPCIMCAGAIGWSQISRIVIGAPDPRRGYSAYMGQGARVRSPFHPRATVTSQVMTDECLSLLQTFFINRR